MQPEENARCAAVRAICEAVERVRIICESMHQEPQVEDDDIVVRMHVQTGRCTVLVSERVRREYMAQNVREPSEISDARDATASDNTETAATSSIDAEDNAEAASVRGVREVTITYTSDIAGARVQESVDDEDADEVLRREYKQQQREKRWQKMREEARFAPVKPRAYTEEERERALAQYERQLEERREIQEAKHNEQVREEVREQAKQKEAEVRRRIEALKNDAIRDRIEEMEYIERKQDQAACEYYIRTALEEMKDEINAEAQRQRNEKQRAEEEERKKYEIYEEGVEREIRERFKRRDDEHERRRPAPRTIYTRRRETPSVSWSERSEQLLRREPGEFIAPNRSAENEAASSMRQNTDTSVQDPIASVSRGAIPKRPTTRMSDKVTREKHEESRASESRREAPIYRRAERLPPQLRCDRDAIRRTNEFFEKRRERQKYINYMWTRKHMDSPSQHDEEKAAASEETTTVEVVEKPKEREEKH